MLAILYNVHIYHEEVYCILTLKTQLIQRELQYCIKPENEFLIQVSKVHCRKIINGGETCVR